jgi:hypothetical protein
MGTRNLTAVVLGGKYKIAQYGQWDGYPKGQGLTCLNFLRSVDLDAFKAKVATTRFGSKAELKAIFKPYTDDEGWMNMTQAEAFAKSPYAYLSRNTGAGILQVVMDAPDGILLQDDHEFAADGLFCEWAYVIDLDRRTFEIYRGFQRRPVPPGQRFYHLNKLAHVSHDKSVWYPVQLLRSYPLDALPTDEAFLKLENAQWLPDSVHEGGPDVAWKVVDIDWDDPRYAILESSDHEYQVAFRSPDQEDRDEWQDVFEALPAFTTLEAAKAALALKHEQA